MTLRDCPGCSGSGPCGICEGTGKIGNRRTFTIEMKIVKRISLVRTEAVLDQANELAAWAAQAIGGHVAEVSVDGPEEIEVQSEP